MSAPETACFEGASGAVVATACMSQLERDFALLENARRCALDDGATPTCKRWAIIRCVGGDCVFHKKKMEYKDAVLAVRVFAS